MGHAAPHTVATRSIVSRPLSPWVSRATSFARRFHRTEPSWDSLTATYAGVVEPRLGVIVDSRRIKA
jgi:hypothetical protein